MPRSPRHRRASRRSCRSGSLLPIQMPDHLQATPTSPPPPTRDLPSHPQRPNRPDQNPVLARIAELADSRQHHKKRRRHRKKSQEKRLPSNPPIRTKPWASTSTFINNHGVWCIFTTGFGDIPYKDVWGGWSRFLWHRPAWVQGLLARTRGTPRRFPPPLPRWAGGQLR